MDDDALEFVLGKLDGVRQHGGYWMALCPAHPDSTPSLSIQRGKEQPVVFYCHAGCERDAILDAIGLTVADVSKPREKPSGLGTWRDEPIVSVYDYVDERGRLLFQVCRTTRKNFPPRRMDPTAPSGWRWGLGKTRRVLYRLPKLLAAIAEGKTVYIVEGEKDVQSMEAAGAIATTSPGGGKSWRDEYNEFFKGADVVIVADRDDTGRTRAADIATRLCGLAKSVRIAEPVKGKDATDHLAAGHSPEEFTETGRPVPDDPVLARLEELRGALLDSDALDSIPAPEPVIDGLLYRDGIAWLYGKPGTYKSIIALDWASCVSVGLPWQGHEAVQGPVLYLYIEGRAGLRQRIRAWEDRAGCKSQVVFLPVAVQLLTPVDLAAFTALVAEMKPSMVVLDTQARVTIGAEENSAMEMGKVVDAAGRIVSTCRPCLLIIHHEGRSGDNPRGSIAIEGAATSLFRADRDGDRITLENKRQRDTAEADDIVLRAVSRLQSVIVDSNVAHWSTPLPSASEKLVLQTLSETFLESGASATLLIKATGLSESTFYHALKNLVSAGKVLNEGTRGRTRYVVAPESELQLTPMNSNGTAPDYSNSNPPYRGLECPESIGAQDAEGWPEGSIGREANG